MARRLNVKALRTRHGMSQSDLARHIWGDDLTGDTLLARKRTIRKWENDGRQPSPMAAKSMQSLVDSSRGSNDDTPNRGADASAAAAAPPRGPRRVSVGGMLPSMEDA